MTNKTVCEHVDIAGRCVHDAAFRVADATDASPDASIAFVCLDHVTNAFTTRGSRLVGADVWWTVHSL